MNKHHTEGSGKATPPVCRYRCNSVFSFKNNRLHNLASAEKKTGENVNVSYFIASIAIKKSIFKK